MIIHVDNEKMGEGKRERGGGRGEEGRRGEEDRWKGGEEERLDQSDTISM